MRAAPLLLALVAACTAAPAWQGDLQQALLTARGERRELVVFFALPGRDQSDRMQASLGDPAVLAALAAGDFVAVTCDGQERARLYDEWVGGGEGMGIAVLDGEGRVYAVRPGPQDPPELAAFLRRCMAARSELATWRHLVAQPAVAPLDRHQLGCLLLELGCRKQAEPLLVDAAMAGVVDARHRLARLHALDGNVAAARRWLRDAPKTPAAQVTEGYVLFKERRHAEAVAVFDGALAAGGLGADRQRALLYLGKALHEARQDQRAVPLLEALAAEGTGSTFEAAALHTLGHIRDAGQGHAH